MQLTFQGGARTVTGSQHLIEVNGRKILLDCGLFQGRRKEAFAINRAGHCEGAAIDALVLSHAHIDHSGNIPCLVRNGFRGDIFCTAATRDLCAVMLADSAAIQERDVEYVNKRRKRNGQRQFEPLYTQRDAARAMELFVGLGYNRPRQILPGVLLTLVDAGHMLGSAHIILDIDDREMGRQVRLVFSGDIGRAGIPIIRDPQPVTEGADILIMESTYGNRRHPPYPESDQDLARIVNETFRKGGALLIPAFAVGRTQQLVYTLHRLFEQGAIPAMPVYVDSPLAARVTDIFQLHPETYDLEMQDFLRQDGGRNPFHFEALHYTRSAEDSKRLNELIGPAIIISSSGMMEHGRILHHLRHRVADSRNTILVTGWQAPDTLGRRLVAGEKTVRIFGEEFPVRATVVALTGYSGHADQDGLLAWVMAMHKKPAQVFIVHGEEDAARNMAELIRGAGIENVSIPEPHQSVVV